MTRKELGEKIREARLQKGLSGEKLGEKIGTDRRVISQIENGSKNYGIDYFLKIAEQLEIII